jgi:hypothetical protein
LCRCWRIFNISNLCPDVETLPQTTMGGINYHTNAPNNHRNHGIIVSIGGLEHLVRLLLPTLLSEIKIHQN